MVIETKSLLGGVSKSLEHGLEGGIWTGLIGSVVGFSVLPVTVAWATILAALAFGVEMSLVGFLGVGLSAAAVTGVVAYKTNKSLAKVGAMAGGLIGFAKGTEQTQVIGNGVNVQGVGVNAAVDIAAEKATDPHSAAVQRVEDLLHPSNKPHTHVHADNAQRDTIVAQAEEGLNKIH